MKAAYGKTVRAVWAADGGQRFTRASSDPTTPVPGRRHLVRTGFHHNFRLAPIRQPTILKIGSANKSHKPLSPHGPPAYFA